MSLVPHKITALAESDAQGTDGKNIVAGAVVSLFDEGGTAVTLFDDESGTNGSTAKQTDATGQVVVYVTAGEYDEEVNGSVRRKVSVGGNSVVSYEDTASLQASRPNKTGQRAENRERANAQYVLAESGYTALPGDLTAANGRVWKLLVVDGVAVLEMFGGSSAERLQAAYDSGAVNIKASLNEYDFGPISGDSSLFTFTRHVNVDFNNATVKVQGDNSSAFTGTSFITFLDTSGCVGNYAFEDENFSQAGPSRGVIPVQIKNEFKNASGYTFYNFKILKGQSLLTAFSLDPNNFRASNIKFTGDVEGVDVYYGVNLANNGDLFEGSYLLGDFKRAFFGYGTKGANVNYLANQGQASSAALLVSSTGSTSPATEDYNIKATYKALNGVIAIKGNPLADTGTYRNISLDVNVESIGTNITNSSLFFIGDSSVPAASYTIDGLNLKLTSEVDFANAINVLTSSPNIKNINLETNGSRNVLGFASDLKGISVKDQTKALYEGDLTAGAAFVRNKDLNQGQSGASLFSAEIDLVLYNDTAFFGQRVSYAKYFIAGFVSGAGVPTFTATEELHRVDVGSAPHPSISFTGVTGGVEISGDTFANTSSRISATVKPLRF